MKFGVIGGIAMSATAFTTVASFAAAPIRRSQPTIVKLAAPKAYFSTMPRRIDNAGRIVGIYMDKSGGYHGFRLVNGVYTTIDPPIPAGAQLGWISANGKGDLVGYYALAQHSHGFLWSGGIYTPIDYPNSSGTRVADINSHGTVVGCADGHIFLWSRGHFMMINVPGVEVSDVFGINDKGQIIGHGGAKKDWFSFIFYHGTYVKLDIPKSRAVMPYGLNSGGQVVGEFLPAHGSAIGFVWTRGKFATIAQTGNTVPFGINDKGQIVGFNSGAHGPMHGFLRASPR